MNKKGLTLIELIAVMVVLGLLALLIVPNVNKLIKDSKNDAKRVNEDNIKQAASMYLADNIGGTISFVENDSYDVTLNQLVDGGYLSSEVMDTYNLYTSTITITKDGNNYVYKLNLNTK